MTSRLLATARTSALALIVLVSACSSPSGGGDGKSAPVLVLKDLEPAYGDPRGGKDVQIVGDGFDVKSKVVVMFGDKPARAIVVAKDRIQLESPAGKEGDEVSVTVRFPDGRSGTLPMHYRWRTGD